MHQTNRDRDAGYMRIEARAAQLGGDAETWLRLQTAYDLAQARQVKPVSRRKLQEPRPS